MRKPGVIVVVVVLVALAAALAAVLLLRGGGAAEPQPLQAFMAPIAQYLGPSRLGQPTRVISADESDGSVTVRCEVRRPDGGESTWTFELVKGEGPMAWRVEGHREQ